MRKIIYSFILVCFLQTCSFAIITEVLDIGSTLFKWGGAGKDEAVKEAQILTAKEVTAISASQAESNLAQAQMLKDQQKVLEYTKQLQDIYKLYDKADKVASELKNSQQLVAEAYGAAKQMAAKPLNDYLPGSGDLAVAATEHGITPQDLKTFINGDFDNKWKDVVKDKYLSKFRAIMNTEVTADFPTGRWETRGDQTLVQMRMDIDSLAKKGDISSGEAILAKEAAAQVNSEAHFIADPIYYGKKSGATDTDLLGQAAQSLSTMQKIMLSQSDVYDQMQNEFVNKKNQEFESQINEILDDAMKEKQQVLTDYQNEVQSEIASNRYARDLTITVSIYIKYLFAILSNDKQKCQNLRSSLDGRQLNKAIILSISNKKQAAMDKLKGIDKKAILNIQYLLSQKKAEDANFETKSGWDKFKLALGIK